ncbi:helix-turn-helix transcriptional regulator [Janthinobacterium sp.]|uniref:helix-turn-helix transcriptional regulator n=1 Tax=Janthinobacterium sp. TaxID=1871054 RepID=UPI00293D6CB7|nr:helix-turn-helix transcriptional regulator [Janthinobacterium sp.]
MSADPGKPRGVLRPAFERGAFEHRREAPSAPLRALVEHYWYVSWDMRGLPAQRQETLPHPNVQMVFEAGAGRIYGVQTERFVRLLEGRDQVFGVKFRAGGFYPFLGAPVSTLADRALPVDEVFGAGAATLAGRILGAADMAARVAIAEDFLLARLPAVDSEVARVGALVAAIAADHGVTAVAQLTAGAGLDKRALQRLFQKYVGIGPKWVIQRYRLHEAVARVQEGGVVAWTELALALGYFDQAHFIRDFRRLVGSTPSEYARSLA